MLMLSLIGGLMLEAITRRLKHDKRGVSNVIVVMLSLVLIVIIVGNVVLWSYQMNQLDLERMQETINIANVARITRSSWFTVQNEFSVSAGSRLSGTYTDTKFIDDFHETFREEIASIPYNPSNYTLHGSSTFISGSLTDLQTDNGVYMQFRSYPSAFSSVTETFGNTVAGANSRNTENTIVGSLFTPTKDGEAQSITAYIRMTYSSKNMKCAIYLHSNLSLVAQTEEKTVPISTTWITFNFLTPKPILKANTEYLLVAWSSSGNGNAYLYYNSGTTDQGHYVSSAYGPNFPNPMPNPTHEARAYSIFCTFKPATEETVEVEFTGTSSTESWTNLTWTVDSCFTADGVSTTFQLYNYQTEEYPASGDGYITATIGTIDANVTQSIASDPARFRDANGNWKLKITGTNAVETPFDFKVDLIEFTVILFNIYRLNVNNNLVIDLSTYPLDYVHGIEILIRFNTTVDTEKWFLKTYNWSASTFSDNGFNNTAGNQPTLNEWNDYAINVTDNWRSYVKDDGTLLVEFADEGLNTTQAIAEIDFLGVRAIIDGTRLDLKNSGPLTTHIIAIWITNSTNHQRHNVNLYINSGEEKTYIGADITLPKENFIVKVVTERGNIAIFPVS